MFKKYFFLAVVRKKDICIAFYIGLNSEVNRNIIKPQFDFLHHQEEKALKRLWEVEI